MQERSALHQELKSAIFNPEVLQGKQGDRTLSQWQADAVISALQKFYPHIEQVYAGHLDKLRVEPEAYPVSVDLEKLAQVIDTPGSFEQVDSNMLAQTLAQLSQQVSRELAHRDAMLDTAIRIQGAMIRLLVTNDVYIGTHWLDDGVGTQSRLGQPALFAHVWSFGADSEEIPVEKILFVADLVARFGPQAIQAWVCHVRGWSKPLKGDLGIKGLETLSYLESLAREAQSMGYHSGRIDAPDDDAEASETDPQE